jgi:dihydrodipicolinate reductase
MKVLVGHGKMGQLVGTLAPHYDCEVAGVIDPGSAWQWADAERWVGVDVAIDFSTPDSVIANAQALAGGGSTW